MLDQRMKFIMQEKIREREMVNFNDRSFISHAIGMFDKVSLTETRERFLNVETERQKSVVTDRREAVEKVGSDSMRKDITWYELWKFNRNSILDLIGPFTLVMFQYRLDTSKT